MHGRKYGAAVSDVLRAFIGEVEAPRRAIQQSNAEVTLERGKGPHHRRHGSIESGCCRGEAAFFDDADKRRHGIQLVHRVSITSSDEKVYCSAPPLLRDWKLQ
jgi:hypothetical protein